MSAIRGTSTCLPAAGPPRSKAWTVSGPATVQALLRGGPAAGKQVEVPRIADTYPLFIGVDGGNYVRDKGATERPVYNWWPSGASSPAGDPTARADAR